MKRGGGGGVWLGAWGGRAWGVGLAGQPGPDRAARRGPGRSGAGWPWPVGESNFTA